MKNCVFKESISTKMVKGGWNPCNQDDGTDSGSAHPCGGIDFPGGLENGSRNGSACRNCFSAYVGGGDSGSV